MLASCIHRWWGGHQVPPHLSISTTWSKLSLKTFMKSFPRLFATMESYMKRGVQILKTKRRKHKPGFKVVIQWAWRKVIWMICNSSLVKCKDKWWTWLFQFRIPHILNYFILKCFVKWLVYWKSLLTSKVRSEENHLN